MVLYHDNPSSQGVANALRRAKQFAEVSYTPVRRLPIVFPIMTADGEAPMQFAESYSPACFPLDGLIYSSVRRVEKYIGFNISLETFLTAVANPNSVVYTRPIEGTGQNVHCFYGIVCSCFASYVHDLHYRTPCNWWKTLPGVTEVDTTEMEALQLCDLVLRTGAHTHIAIITDIERDECGGVHYISVTESHLPKIRTNRYTPDEFRRFWLADGYRVYHNANVDKVTYTPSPFVHVEGDPVLPEPEINRTLLPDFGNKANYLLDKEPVELSVFDENCTSVEVTAPDGSTQIYPVEGGRVIVHPAQLGFYHACGVCGGEKSATVEWCTVDLELSVEKEAYAFGEDVTIHFSNPMQDKVVAWQFTRLDTDKIAGTGHIDNLTDGTLTLKAPNTTGEVVLIVVSRNRFGDYSSRRIVLTIREAK